MPYCVLPGYLGSLKSNLMQKPLDVIPGMTRNDGYCRVLQEPQKLPTWRHILSA